MSSRLEPAAAHLLAACGAAPGHRLLDVGAGDGNLALAAARAGVEVVASDLSPALVEQGRERLKANGLEVEWDVADVESLPYPDGSFDCVASNFGAIHADDPRRAVGELERVLRPGGTLALTAWTTSGLMGGVLRLAARQNGSTRTRARPERWGRYETAMLHFSRFEGFEMLEATLPMAFDTEEEMLELFTRPPGPLAGVDLGESRETLLRLAADHRVESKAGVTLEVGYAVLIGRKQAPASG